MKKRFFIHVVCVMFLVSCLFAGQPVSKLKTVKENYGYADWAAETGKVIPGLTISQDILPQLEGMSKVWETDSCRIENIGGNTFSRIRQWWKSADRSLEIAVVVCPTFSAAKEYLISSYAETQIAPQYTKQKGSDSGLNIGNLCYVTPLTKAQGFADIDFIRHNVLILMRAEGDSRNDLGDAAGILDGLLLRKSQEDSYSALKDLPVITRFACEKAEIKQGKRVLLDLEVDDSTGGELRYFWETSGGGVKKGLSGDFVYYAGDVGRQTITVTVLNDLGLYGSKSLEIEVVK